MISKELNYWWSFVTSCYPTTKLESQLKMMLLPKFNLVNVLIKENQALL